MPTSVWICLIVAGVLAALLVFWFVGMSHEIQGERARELFRLQRSRLESQFLAAAQRTGSPRGLVWLSCVFDGECVFAWDRTTRRVTAFAPVTIRFEAEPDGEMVGLPAVEQAREATALLVFERGQWTTVGKVVFNHTPEQTLDRFAGQYQRIAE